MIAGLSSSREKMILAIGVALGSALLIQRGIYVPLRDWRNGLNDRIEHAEVQLRKSDKILQRSRAYEKEYAPFLKIYTWRGSEEQAMSALLSEIDQAARGANVQVLEIKPLKGRKTDLTGEFKIDISLEGSLADVVDYIHRLQVQPHLFHVEEFRVERKTAMADMLKCHVLIKKLLIKT